MIIAGVALLVVRNLYKIANGSIIISLPRQVTALMPYKSRWSERGVTAGPGVLQSLRMIRSLEGCAFAQRTSPTVMVDAAACCIKMKQNNFIIGPTY